MRGAVHGIPSVVLLLLVCACVAAQVGTQIPIFQEFADPATGAPWWYNIETEERACLRGSMKLQAFMQQAATFSFETVSMYVYVYIYTATLQSCHASGKKIYTH